MSLKGEFRKMLPWPIALYVNCCMMVLLVFATILIVLSTISTSERAAQAFISTACIVISAYVFVLEVMKVLIIYGAKKNYHETPSGPF